MPAHGARRRPETTPLYAVVHEYLETFLAEAPVGRRVLAPAPESAHGSRRVPPGPRGALVPPDSMALGAAI